MSAVIELPNQAQCLLPFISAAAGIFLRKPRKTFSKLIYSAPHNVLSVRTQISNELEAALELVIITSSNKPEGQMKVKETEFTKVMERDEILL